MNHHRSLALLIAGLSVSAALTVLMIPALLSGDLPVPVWIFWVLAGMSAACAAGIIVNRHKGT